MQPLRAWRSCFLAPYPQRGSLPVALSIERIQTAISRGARYGVVSRRQECRRCAVAYREFRLSDWRIRMHDSQPSQQHSHTACALCLGATSTSPSRNQHTHTHTVFTFFLGAAFTSPARRQNSHTAFLFFLRVARTSPDASNAQAPHVRKSFERHLDSQHTNQHSPTAFAPLLRATSTSPAVPAVSMSASSWIHRDRCTGPSTPLMAGSWRPRWSPRSPATLVVEKYV